MTVHLQFGKILNAVSGKYQESGNSLVLDYPCPSQTSCHSVEVVLFAGKYELSVWGAEGGGCGLSAGELGGKGGYSKGTISFRRETKLLFFIGGKGISGGGSDQAEAQGGFNGGGKGYSGRAGDNKFGPSGGGASDIRFEDNTTILIAGGGRGSSFWHQTSGNYSGGFGGGLNGGSGGDHNTINNRGLGGTQTANGFCQFDSAATTATRGNGRNGGNGKPCGRGSGGGGGGYFGGGGGYCGGGGGGSGFVSSMFENGITMNGAESFETAKTSANETGHTGNGNAKIILLSSKISFFTNRPENLQNFSSLFYIFIVL